MFELNPILVKELRSRMRGARAFVLLTIYLLILSAVTLLLYAALAANVGNDLNAGRDIGKTLFLTVAGVALVEVCLITPVLTSGSIAGEKERQSYDLLIASLLTPWQIVWGKLASALAFALLLIVSIVPVMSLAFLFGGVSLTEVLIALAGLVATAVLYATIGLFWSTVTRSSLGATSFALGSVILLLLGVPFVIVIITLLLGRDVSADLLEAPLFIYLSRLFIAMHPFIALGATANLIQGGGGTFIEVVEAAGSTIVVPSPWLLYVVFALIGSGILMLLSVRMLGPAQPTSDSPGAPPPRAASSADA